MKYLKLILIIVIIAALGICGYYGYNYFKKWEASRFSEMTMLKFNQELFLKKVTELSETITHVVNDTAKTTTTPKSDATYEGLKNEVIALKAEGTASKEEIEKLREELSAQRQAFLASDDTILIKTVDGTLLLYRDTEGTLQPASEGIEKIIEHKDVSDIVVPVVEIETKKDLGLKAGGYYSFDKTYGVIISKELFDFKEISINASILIADFEDFKLIAGGDIGYLFKDNLELGAGYNTNKEYYVKFQYSF